MQSKLLTAVAIAAAAPLFVPGAPERTLARFADGTELSSTTYSEYLIEQTGLQPLREYVFLELLRAEAERAGVALAEGELDAAVEERWLGFLDARFRGDRTALEAEFAEAHMLPRTYRFQLRGSLLRELLLPRLALQRREVTDEGVAAAFEQEYGAGGVRVVVRHLLLNRGNTRRLLERQGVPPNTLDADALDRHMLAKADELLAELRGGASFESVARRESHDRSVHQNGGVIPGYNYIRYGEVFADAVRAAEVGAVVGPVQDTDRVHLLVVEERVVTPFEDVREELRAKLALADPGWDELMAVEAAIWAENPVEFLLE